MSSILAELMGKVMAVSVQEEDGGKFPPLQPDEISVGEVPEDLRPLAVAAFGIYREMHARSHEDLRNYATRVVSGEVQREKETLLTLGREHTTAAWEEYMLVEVLHFSLRMTFLDAFLYGERPEIREGWQVVVVPSDDDDFPVVLGMTVIRFSGIL